MRSFNTCFFSTHKNVLNLYRHALSDFHTLFCFTQCLRKNPAQKCCYHKESFSAFYCITAPPKECRDMSDLSDTRNTPGSSTSLSMHLLLWSHPQSHSENSARKIYGCEFFNSNRAFPYKFVFKLCSGVILDNRHFLLHNSTSKHIHASYSFVHLLAPCQKDMVHMYIKLMILIVYCMGFDFAVNNLRMSDTFEPYVACFMK